MADLRDCAGGTAIAAVGAVFLFTGMGYNLGTVRSIGPGAFPVLISGLLVVVGVIIALKGLFRHSVVEVSFASRPFVAVCASFAMFALLIERLGFVPAVLVSVATSSLGDPEFDFFRTGALALGLAFGTWLIFSVGLGLPTPAFRAPRW